jgi:hypothetical protein
LKSQVQAFIVIAIAGVTLIVVLFTSAQLGTVYSCGGGCPPVMLHETVVMQSYILNSLTNATLMLKNTGSVAVYLAAYKVTGPNGLYFANTNWTGPAIGPNYIGAANVLIDGKAFTFQSSSSYSISITTSRNTQFQFTI